MSKVLYPGEVINNNDPMFLGRIRAYPLDQNTKSVLDGFSFVEGRDDWSVKDPYVFLPLLPMFLSQTPQIGERVSLIFGNDDRRFQDAYFVQGAFSSPMTLPFESAPAANKNTSLGYRISQTLSLKNLDGSLKNTKTFGVFPELKDVALLGRGTADIIVKPETVLIRAGKTKSLSPNKYPIANEQRSYLQVSSFNSKITERPPQDLIKLTEVQQQTKKLIEWNIYNLDNTQNAFTGDISLFDLKPSNLTLTTNIKYDSQLETSKFLQYSEQFQGLTLEETITAINKFINGVNNGKIENGPVLSGQFPFVYRPNSNIRDILKPGSTSVDPFIFSNATNIFQKVSLNIGFGQKSFGFGLVGSKDKIGPPTQVDIETITPKVTENTFGTFIFGAADTIVFSSNKSNNPISFSPKLSQNPNTMMGISQSQLVDDVLPKTFSIARGERLIDYLKKIELFLKFHVHPYHGMPPDSVSYDGTSKSSIFIDPSQILNENIRIN